MFRTLNSRRVRTKFLWALILDFDILRIIVIVFLWFCSPWHFSTNLILAIAWCNFILCSSFSVCCGIVSDTSAAVKISFVMEDYTDSSPTPQPGSADAARLVELRRDYARHLREARRKWPHLQEYRSLCRALTARLRE